MYLMRDARVTAHFSSQIFFYSTARDLFVRVKPLVTALLFTLQLLHCGNFLRQNHSKASIVTISRFRNLLHVLQGGNKGITVKSGAEDAVHTEL